MEIKARGTLETDYWCFRGFTRAAFANIKHTQFSGSGVLMKRWSLAIITIFLFGQNQGRELRCFTWLCTIVPYVQLFMFFFYCSCTLS